MANTHTSHTAMHESDDGDIQLSQLMVMLRRRKWTILTITSLALIISTLISIQITPRYTATAKLLLQPDEASTKVVSQLSTELDLGRDNVSSQLQIVTSKEAAGLVVDRYNLMTNPLFDPHAETKTTLVDDAISGARSAVSTLVSLVQGPKETTGDADGLTEEAISGDILLGDDEVLSDRAIVIQRVLAGLNANVDGRSYVINVSYDSPHPKVTAALANGFARAYIDIIASGRKEQVETASKWLADRVESLHTQVLSIEREIEAYKVENDLINSADANLSSNNLTDMNSQLVRARIEKAEMVAQLEHTRELLRSGKIDLIDEVSSSSLIASLRDQEALVIRREAELKTRFGPKHPQILDVQAERRNLQTRISTEVTNIVGRLESEVVALDARERSLEDELSIAQVEAAGLNEAEIGLRELERQAEANRKLYQAFLARFKESTKQIDFQREEARVISSATEPAGASSPNIKLIIGLSVLTALVGAIGLVFLLEHLDRGFKTAEDVEQGLGLPTLGLMPQLTGFGASKQKPFNYILKKPMSAYGEAVQGLRTGLRLSNVDNPPKVVMCTSSVPGEGKTTLSLSLARLCARSGQKTILVDLDLRKPSVDDSFGWKSKAGVVDVMNGSHALEDVIRLDNESGLHVLPVGTLTTNPVDVLSSNRMKDLIEHLRETYEMVIVDSAPLLGVTDTRVAATLVDKVVFVIHWQQTPVEIASAALQSVTSHSDNIAGAILNHVDLKKHASYGYGDSGYYYGKYQKYYVN